MRSLSQEFKCILHGFLYFLAVPSMSMLLIFYSLANLHVVSWGTREAPKPANPQPGKEVKKENQGYLQRLLSSLTSAASLSEGGALRLGYCTFVKTNLVSLAILRICNGSVCSDCDIL